MQRGFSIKRVACCLFGLVVLGWMLFKSTVAQAQNPKYPFAEHPFEDVDHSHAQGKGTRSGEKEGGPPPPPDPVPISDHLWLLLLLGGSLGYWYTKKRQPSTER